MDFQLKISGEHYNSLKNHLLPNDKKESIAIALCGRHIDEDCQCLFVHEVILIPYEDCQVRENDLIQWSTNKIIPFFKRLTNTDFGILKIHSHPLGLRSFSEQDDFSDKELFDSVYGWSNTGNPHASAIMMPDGEIIGRYIFSDLHFEPISKISIAGDRLLYFGGNSDDYSKPEFALRTIQTFGDTTYQKLKGLKIAVVGCSGTGSPVIEQLVRLGVGELILVDPDIVEFKNLNRIINSKYTDAKKRKPKVEAIANAIEEIGLGTKIKVFQKNLFDDIATLKAILKSDGVFGCMDSVDGRFLLNQLCSFYLLPYFDLGVKLEADGEGGINQIVASVHYVQPLKSSLLTRNLFDMNDVRASSQYRKNPEEFLELKKNAYIKNVNVNSPAVISINMTIASHAINDFLNRIHPYKVEEPNEYASSTIDITEGYIINGKEETYEVDHYLAKRAGRGDMTPFIEMPELSK
ncbi:ThiF family adenylyltransferase [Mariniphaga sediminis]|uniref:ThiF family adenylyltransferase n=1 Tax=Mariniphaga sediminis TaxID=1628158 RepID=A0A399D626_9BACT|nr:ThiF family adenylyltransferase [Mariniphaga sediminis]RIH66191.1 ThiF family adenylyltransferase [Mariniphaga sediminis]